MNGRPREKLKPVVVFKGGGLCISVAVLGVHT